MNYQKLGLNNRLVSDNGIAGRPRNAVTAYQFDSLNDPNIIDTPKVRTLAFGKLKGGTCSLGGTADGDGVLSVSERAGTEIVRLDKAGITVNHGSITVKNTGGTTSIDSSGVVSTSNFVLTNYNGGPSQSFTGTTAVDVTGSEQEIVVGRTVNVLFLYATTCYLIESAGNTADGETGLDIDGVYPKCHTQFHSGETNLETRCNFFVTTLSAGTTTVKAQSRLATIYAGTPSMTLSEFSWTYIILGT